MRSAIRSILPLSIRAASRAVRAPRQVWSRKSEFKDFAALLLKGPRLSLIKRLRLVRDILTATYMLDCPHSDQEILAFVRCILSLRHDGVLVEAGCYKGCSTAKFSVAANLTGRKLIVFDSFQGLPASKERHTFESFTEGEFPDFAFKEGKYAASLEEVQRNVGEYGCLQACQFVPGWFEDTMPAFRMPIAAAYLDVDLVESTKTCIKYLWPLIVPGGFLFSQDAHLSLIVELLRNRDFWARSAGEEPPEFSGLGTRKLVWACKGKNQDLPDQGWPYERIGF